MQYLAGADKDESATDPAPGIETSETPGAEGGKDRIHYSVTTPEEEKKAAREEKEKFEKSWDVLRNIVIDRRGKR